MARTFVHAPAEVQRERVAGSPHHKPSCAHSKNGGVWVTTTKTVEHAPAWVTTEFFCIPVQDEEYRALSYRSRDILAGFDKGRSFDPYSWYRKPEANVSFTLRLPRNEALDALSALLGITREEAREYLPLLRSYEITEFKARIEEVTERTFKVEPCDLDVLPKQRSKRRFYSACSNVPHDWSDIKYGRRRSDKTMKRLAFYGPERVKARDVLIAARHEFNATGETDLEPVDDVRDWWWD